MGLRVCDTDYITEILMVIEAAKAANTPLTVSVSGDYLLKDKIPGHIVQSDLAFIAEMSKYERIRAISPESLSDAVYRKAAELGLYIADAKPIAEGRLELLHYLKEQSIAFEYHRYGSIFGEKK